MKASKTLGWGIAALGLWEIAAPFVLGYAASAVTAQAILIGVIWIAFGLWSALTNKGEAIKLLGWLSVFVGLWLFFAPAVMGYTALTAALWNDLLVGFLGMVLGIWQAFKAPAPTAAPQPAAHH